MKVFIGYDHRGTNFAYKLIEWLEDKGYEINEPFDDGSPEDDYPDISKIVCEMVNKEKGSRGVLICGTGIGMCMAANKEKNIRAVFARNEIDAYFARKHEDANVLVLSAGYKDEDKEVKSPKSYVKILEAFFNTPFDGGRHEKRVKKLNSIIK